MSETWQTVTLHGGPLDGMSVPVDVGDPEPGGWVWTGDTP